MARYDLRYVPNNGWASGHFNRRREWDDAMKAFMQRKKDAGVNVMWLGDLVSRYIPFYMSSFFYALPKQKTSHVRLL